MTNKALCSACGTHEPEPRSVEVTFQTRHGEFVITAEGMYCPVIGEEYFTPEQSKMTDRELNTKTAESLNRFTGPEIRDLRKRLELTQVEMEDRYGLGPKTVTRWESGDVVLPAMANFALQEIARSLDEKTHFDDLRERGNAPWDVTIEAQSQMFYVEITQDSEVGCAWTVNEPATEWCLPLVVMSGSEDPENQPTRTRQTALIEACA